ncbi:hypothetical protein ACIQV3_32695 [Streptomyces sp. NPDC099050]|uniref:hypothetical protein n=1 Tax=Streptomyces sp. NPDC099050 TaxID=3366100 RepID=UPI00381D83D6
MTKRDGRGYCGDDGHWAGPSPGHAYVALLGGPLGGRLFHVSGWSKQERAVSALLITDHGFFGAGGRALCKPSPAAPEGSFLWDSDTL